MKNVLDLRTDSAVEECIEEMRIRSENERSRLDLNEVVVTIVALLSLGALIAVFN